MHRLVAILALATAILSAQTNRGSLAGTVTDATGGAIAGAKVTITNIGTNEVRKATSAGNGTFSLADLEPTLYNIQVEAAGFKKSVIENVKVDTGLTAGVAIKLETGSVETKITVQAEAVMVDTESGTSASTINERQIVDAPLVNRSVMDLALTLPNVAGDAGSEEPVLTTVTPCPGCNLTIGGGRPMSNMLMADGTNNTGVSVGRSIVSFTPETVQEFTVTTSVPSAEYGFSGGGVINVTTKSGTNELHGTALWFNRNTFFEAAPWTMATVNRSPATLKDNQFSLAAGGPVWIPKIYNGKNKTFWFAAIEPQYRRDHLDQYGTMPTPGMLNGDFSNLTNTASGWLPNSVVSQFATISPTAVAPTGDSNIYNNYNVTGNQFTVATAPTGSATYPVFPGNVIPQSMIDSAALKAEAYISPASAYFLNSNGLISNIYDPRLLKTNTKRYTVRIDEAISSNNRLYGRWSSTPIVKIAATAVSPTNNGALYSWGQQAMLADTHTFNATLFNDLRLNYTHGRFSNTVDPRWDPISGANLNTEFGLPSITTGGLPTFNSLFPGSSLGGGSSNATGFGGAGSTNVDDQEYRYGITDIVYKNVGAMSFKFGFDGSHALQNVIPLYGAFGGIYTFSNYNTDSIGTSSGTGGSPWAGLMLGTVQSGDVTMRNVEVPYYYRWNTGAGFVQDDWKVKSNLTINIGVRWTVQMPRTEKFNHQGVFRTDLAQSVNLPTPLTLQDGEVITSTLEPPFAFSGLGGNSRYMTPPQYHDIEPRIGFAWQPEVLRNRHVVVRGGWGMTHSPISGFTTLPQPDFGATSTFATIPTSSTVNPTYVMRLGENPPVLTPATPTTQIYGSAGPPSSGMATATDLYYQSSVAAYAVSQDYHTPYANNWNLTLSWQANRSTTVETAYQGAQGIHLFMPQEDMNPKDSNLLTAQISQNVSTTATINDPLGRVNPLTGKVLTVQEGSLGSPYLGFSSLYKWYDSSGNSVRHAGYVNVTHRAARGLTFVANYTYAKSIDVGSSAGGDKNILTPVGGQVGGQVAYGGTRANDRSTSTFDQRHVIHGSAIYDLPFGRGREFLGHMPKALDYVVGGWTVAALVRTNSGFPYMIYLSDSNQLGDLTHSARPDAAFGVPVVNPLWTRSCPTGSGCQPYLNPSAFQRPALGSLGTAPRTEDGARGPWVRYTDMNVQKNFRLGESGKRILQIRMDALNVFNHPVFEVYPNNAGGADFMGAPSTATLSTSSYNTWAAANSQPSYTTAAGVTLYNAIVAMVNGQKTSGGNLPANFYAVRLPSNFYGVAANAYDITTLSGYKNYQLRTAYSTSFGDLYQAGTPRYIQFGLKLYF